MSGIGMNVVRSRLSGMGYVDPTIDTSYDDSTIASPIYGPMPTDETVAQNWLIANGYMTDPNAPASVPSSGLINVASGLPVSSSSPTAPSATSGLINWLSSWFKPAVSQLQPGLPQGPSPRVNVPLTTNSAGMFLTGSTLISGVPNLVVLGGGFLALSLLFSGGKRRRR
jgi:hypothetical protein